MRAIVMRNVCLQTYSNGENTLKISLLFHRNVTLKLVNNKRIREIKNVKFSDYYFYMNTNIKGNFQICISVPLSMKG